MIHFFILFHNYHLALIPCVRYKFTRTNPQIQLKIHCQLSVVWVHGRGNDTTADKELKSSVAPYLATDSCHRSLFCHTSLLTWHLHSTLLSWCLWSHLCEKEQGKSELGTSGVELACRYYSNTTQLLEATGSRRNNSIWLGRQKSTKENSNPTARSPRQRALKRVLLAEENRSPFAESC